MADLFFPNLLDQLPQMADFEFVSHFHQKSNTGTTVATHSSWDIPSNTLTPAKDCFHSVPPEEPIAPVFEVPGNCRSSESVSLTIRVVTGNHRVFSSPVYVRGKVCYSLKSF